MFPITVSFSYVIGERRRARAAMAAIAGMGLIVGCGENGGDVTEPPVVASVVVSPGSSTLTTAGETIQLTAEPQDAAGNPISGKTIQWSSSSADVIGVSAAGLATAAGPNGSATITATTDDVSGTAEVEIVTAPGGGTIEAEGGRVVLTFPSGAVDQEIMVTVDAVASPPDADLLLPGTAYEFGPDGTQFNEPVTLTIQFDPSGIPATVDEGELSLYKRVGDVWEIVPGATVDADANVVTGDIDSFSMYACRWPRVETVDVTPEEAAITIEGTVQLAATPRDANGRALRKRGVEWSTEHTDVASVDDDGLVTGVAEGTATIVATSEGATGTATITVSLVPVASVAVTPAESEVTVGETVQLMAQPRDADGNPLGGRAIAWSSESDAIASVDENGLVTGEGEGTTTITATSEGIEGSATVTVAPAPVASVIVSPDEAEIAAGATVLLEAEPRDADGTALDRPVVWSSDSDAIASVDENGLVTGEGEGTTTITATSEGIEGTATITVTPVPVAAVIVTPEEAEIDVGATVQLDAEPRDADGNPLVGRTVTWMSGDDDVASVDQDGLVTGEAQGMTTITATSEGIEGMASITVELPPMGDLFCGSLLEGSIGGSGEVDQYTFSGQADDIVVITLVETTDWGGLGGANDARGTLFSPSLVQVGNVFDSNVQPRFELTESGTHTVRVNANNLVSTGDYNLGLECIRPIPNGTPTLTLGDLVTASIDIPGEVDLFQLSGTAGDQITLTLVEVTDWGGLGGANDARGALYDPQGNPVGGVFDSNAQPVITLPASGTYLLQINANNLVSAGSYAIGLEGIFPTTPDVTDAAIGDLLSGAIDAAGEADLYRFTGEAGDIVAITLVETTDWGGLGGANDARGTLYAPSGAPVGAAFDSNIQPVLTLPESGTYVLRINANNLISTGSYNVGFEGLSPATADVVPIGEGDLIGGAIEDPGEVDLFAFDGEQDQQVTLTMVETSNWGGLGGANDARATIYRPDGQQLGSPIDSDVQTQLTLPSTGTYLVQISANNLVGIGTYTLGLESIDPPNPVQGTLTCGALLGGAIDASGEVDLLTFDASSGASISITLVETSDWGGLGGANDARGTLHAPSGTAVGSAFDSNAQVEFALTESGSYVLQVNANNLVSIGTYNVGLTCLAP